MQPELTASRAYDSQHAAVMDSFPLQRLLSRINEGMVGAPSFRSQHEDPLYLLHILNLLLISLEERGSNHSAANHPPPSSFLFVCMSVE